MEIAMRLYGVYEVTGNGNDELDCLFLTEEDATEFIASEERVIPGVSAKLMVRPVNVYELYASVAAIDEDTRWTIC